MKVIAVIAIYEENHGMIEVAASKKAACQFLVRDNWFCACDEVWVPSLRQSITAYELIGKPVEDITNEELAEFLLKTIEHEDRETCFLFCEEEIQEEE